MYIAKRCEESPERLLRYQRRQTSNKDGCIVWVRRGELFAIGANKVAQDRSCLCVVFPRFLVDYIPISLSKCLSELSLVG